VRLLAPDRGSKEEVPEEMEKSEWTFMGIADALKSSGYCLLQTSQSQQMQEMAMGEADRIMDFVRPYSDFEDAYLGTESNSKVWWCHDTLGVELGKNSAWEQYNQQIDAIQDLLASMTGMDFGVLVEPRAGPKLFRRTCKSPQEHRKLRTDLSKADPTSGVEARFLDFVQRRRLCVLYVVSCSESTSVEFRPRDDDYFPWSGTTKLQLAAGQLLIFQHDLLAYTYKSEDSNDLVLQSWLLEEPRSLEVNELFGNDEAIFAALQAQGSTIPRNEEVHIQGVAYRLSTGIQNIAGLECAISAGIDGVKQIPQARWDHDPYYDEEGVIPGKCACKHGAFMNEDQFYDFDNTLFGYEYEDAKKIAPPVRTSLEVAYETFIGSAGLTKEMLRGANLTVYDSCGDRINFWWRYVNSMGTEFTLNYTTAAVVSHAFLLTGEAFHCDTACSSTNVTCNLSYQGLRKQRDATKHYQLDASNPLVGGLIISDSYYDAPEGFVGLSAARMVGKKGRARTFEMNADGMQRGEASGAIFQTLLDDPLLGEEIAYVLGGAMNQDGRSASLTAPSGPSQAKILRLAADDIGRPIEDTTTCELHGTGTALGDPIETGSCRSLMVNRKPGTAPLLHSAGKSNSNHNELCAGLSGIVRQIMSIRSGTSPANMHVYTLNSNIDYIGYPALWPNERIPVGLEYIHNGISSFGFGGTNSRYEIWGHCRNGSNKAVNTEKTQAGTVAYTQTLNMKKTPDWNKVHTFLTKCPRCFGTMCWNCGEAQEVDDISSGSPKHRCTMVRSESADYDVCSLCYKGDYIVGSRKVTEAGAPGGRVYIVFNMWNELVKEEMQQMIDGTYVYTINLDETGPVNFNITVDGDPSLTLYPVVSDAPQQARVLGPDSNMNGRSWLIDTSASAIFAAASFQIRLQWDSVGKFVSWEPLTTQPQLEMAPTYSIVGSWNSWTPEHMMQSEEDLTRWEFTFLMSEAGEDEFQFTCGEDFSQAIYPDGYKVDDTSIQILGPRQDGHGRNWLITGKPGEMVKVELKVDRGHITMSTLFEDSESRTKTWKSPVRAMAPSRRFFIAGSWNGWSPDEELQPTAPDVYVFHLTLQDAAAEFQIVLDQDWSRTMYAHSKCILQHGQTCRADGPDGDGHGKNFKVKGPVGATMEICLDLLHSDGPTVSCAPQS